MKLKREPYLIQRVSKPINSDGELGKLSQVFSFGGGLKNGGFTQKAFDEFNKIWNFEYMGSAEFEYGGVPKSLSKVIENKEDYRAYILEIGKEENKTPIYVIAYDDDQYCEDVNSHINSYAEKPYGHRTKESVGLHQVVKGEPSIRDTCGWIDIQNHFLFFTDKDMFEAIRVGFEIKMSE